MIGPVEFLETVVRPNVYEMSEAYDDMRRAYNAVNAVDSLSAHMFAWAKVRRLTECTRDSAYRQELANKNVDFALVRDIAKAQKHIELEDHAPLVSRAHQIESKAVGYGEGGFAEGRWGGPPQVVVTLNDGQTRAVETIVGQALHFLETEMRTLGLAVPTDMTIRPHSVLPGTVEEPLVLATGSGKGEK